MSVNCLDAARILRETFVARLEHHEALTSTNDRAAEAARNGAGDLPLLIVADRQTAGRGRGRNRWWTGPGSLAFSLLLAPEHLHIARQNGAPLVSLATALAVIDAVAPLLPDHRVGLHWPNDVLAACPLADRAAGNALDGRAAWSGDRKLAGILIETLADGRHIVGIGVNTNNSLADAPPELQQSLATLRDLTGRTHDHAAILIALLQRLEKAYAAMAGSPEQTALRADALCLQRGRRLTVEQGGEAISGCCCGIAPDGALRLETPEGMRNLYSGVLRKER